MQKKSAFTLVELLVVVGIIALISGLVLPLLFKARDKAKKQLQEQRQKLAEKAEAIQKSQKKAETQSPEGALPIIEAATLQMNLSSSSHRLGMDVYTRYEAHCKGEVTFRHPGDTDAPLLLAIPFPEAITEARDVKLSLQKAGAQQQEPDNVLYQQQGIYWTGNVAKGESITAHIAFVAVGRENFFYRLPLARQMRSVKLSLVLDGVNSPVIPDRSLQPTKVGNRTLDWEFKSLVSDRPIIIEIPGARSPLGKVMLLFRLMAVAVLLFGAGLWYLAEQQKPGLLDSFRWGHFLLLALTYSLFFVIFSVLGFQGTLSTGTAMAISAVFSLPLLVLHVSRVVGFSFAFSRILPLAAFTLAIVVNGVYGGEIRDYAFIAATIIVITYLTLTYDKWAKRREVYHQECKAKAIETKAALSQKISAEIGELMANAGIAIGEAGALLDIEDEKQLQSLRQTISKEQKHLAQLVKEAEGLSSIFSLLPEETDWAFAKACRSLEEDIHRDQQRLQQALDSLVKNCQLLEQKREFQHSEQTQQVHCIACGESGANTPFCQDCGKPRAMLLLCKGCGEKLTLPTHLLDAKMPEKLHCSKCGAAYRSLQNFTEDS